MTTPTKQEVGVTPELASGDISVEVLAKILEAGASHQKPQSRQYRAGNFNAAADAEFIVAAVKYFISSQSDGWMEIDTHPTAENQPFMILLPKNDVAYFVQLQVTIFEGQMYPDALSGMIDWWSWVGPEQATHWRPCFELPPPPKGSQNDQ